MPRVFHPDILSWFLFQDSCNDVINIIIQAIHSISEMEEYHEKRIPNNGIHCRRVIICPFAFGLLSASPLCARTPWAPPWIAKAALIEVTVSGVKNSRT
jgi:hypothetical protein